MGAFDNEPLIIDAPKERNPFSYNTLLHKYKDSLKDDSITFTDEEKATENYQTIDLYYKQYKTFTENGSYARKMLKATGNEWLKMYTELHNLVGRRRYQWKELKTILEAIYLKYGMNRKPKETDLSELGFEYQIKKVHGYKYIDIL